MGQLSHANLFRWLWYLDFGKTPEESWDHFKSKHMPWLSPACDKSTSIFSLSIDEFLQAFKSHISQAGRKYNFDARAIAGVIAWEYEKNLKGRFSDYLQYGHQLKKGLMFGQGFGWGSMHTDTLKKMYPNKSDQELTCMRMQAIPVIEAHAKYIDHLANEYYKSSGGIWIRDNPAVLALFFNTGENLLYQSAAKQKVNVQANDPIVLTINQNEMATWVNSNLSRFSEFRTVPLPPKNYIKFQIK